MEEKEWLIDYMKNGHMKTVENWFLFVFRTLAQLHFLNDAMRYALQVESKTRWSFMVLRFLPCSQVAGGRRLAAGKHWDVR